MQHSVACSQGPVIGGRHPWGTCPARWTQAPRCMVRQITGSPWGLLLSETAVLEGKGRRDRGVFGFLASPTRTGRATQTPRFGQTPARRRAGERGDARGASVEPAPALHPPGVLESGALVRGPWFGAASEVPRPQPWSAGLEGAVRGPRPTKTGSVASLSQAPSFTGGENVVLMSS